MEREREREKNEEEEGEVCGVQYREVLQVLCCRHAWESICVCVCVF